MFSLAPFGFFDCMCPTSYAIFVEVLVLTHERAGAEEIIPYLQYVFWPVPVVCLFGRCAAEEPRINKESCVYYGWKDCTG